MTKIIPICLALAAIMLQISTAKWCTRMGKRAYNVQVDGIETKYITKIEKYCCEGYSLNGTDCKPICHQGCPFGTCAEPNKCVCIPGYQLEPNSNICEPFCSKPCGFGRCSQPEICECDTGHAFDETSGMCQPACDPKCPANSECLRPNQCACNIGYSFNHTTNLCDAICQNECVNSYCAKPDVCECYKGYTKDSPTFHVCRENHCAQPCLMGYCDTNGACHCHDGYTQAFFTSDGRTYCETIAVSSMKVLGIVLLVVFVFAIIVLVLVKVLMKNGTYKPKQKEDAFKQKATK